MRSTSTPAWLALAAFFLADPCRAAEPAPRAGPTAGLPDATPEALDALRRRLREADEAAAAAEAGRRRAEGDLEVVRADRIRLSAALIDATSRVRDLETRASATAERIDRLDADEDGIRRSLASRRSEVAGVLAALQRMGLRPLPALLASPDDMSRAIRSAMLLGAILPGLETAARALASDLAALGRLRSSIAGARDALAAEAKALEGERARLSELVAARQAAQAEAEGTLSGEQRRSAGLARETSSLKELVSRLEGEVAAAQADAAGVAAKALAAKRDPARLAPAVPFVDEKGRLPLPAAGRLLKPFGSPDGYGNQERGLSLATRPGAVVVAPADGWVSFSGPYRSYGQLLILNMGDGYYVVLAGLGRLDVAPGQFVLAGEPLGGMGDAAARAAASIALGAGEPVLYVELRKDGAAIDPSPWWAKAELQKVRG